MIAQSLSILIVEPESQFAQELTHLVKEIGCQVAACISDLSEVFSIVKKDKPDLLLVNAKIKQHEEDTGIIQNLNALKIPIVYIANFNENYDLVKNNNQNAIGFMVKPADKFTLKSCIQIALKEHSNQFTEIDPFTLHRELFFKKGGVYHKISIDSIYFIQSNGDYSIAQTFQGSYSTSLRLNKLEELLENYSFMRVHRGYLINLTKVTSIDSEHFWLSVNGYKIPFSRRIKTKLLNRLPIL